MEKFKQALIEFANSNPNFSRNNDTNSSSAIIQQRFSQFFPDFQTPNHPPYAAMIHKAIFELNKKGGSTEESISKYIRKEYVDLPWAHSTLLKHHLEKLCDGKEIFITRKQRYSLSGTVDSQPVSGSTSDKRLKREHNSESGKKNSGPCKEREKMESGRQQCRKRKRKEKRMADLQDIDKQIILRDEDVQPLDGMIVEQEVDLRTEDESEKILSTTDFYDTGNGSKSSKRRKKHETHVEATLKQNNEVTGSDIQIQEENKVQMMQNPQLLQLEQSPDSNHLLLKDGKRIYTRSQIKSMLKKDALPSSELADPPTYVNVSDPMEITVGKEAEQTPSTEMNGQRAKLRSSQKDKVAESIDTEEQKLTSPSLEMQLILVDEPMQVQETGSEESKDEDKPKKRGRPRKTQQQSADKGKAGSRFCKHKRVVKSKSTKKKKQPKNKRHKMTRRNTKKKSKSLD